MTDAPETSSGKRWYQKWWVWLLIGIGALLVIAVIFAPPPDDEEIAGGETTTTAADGETTTTEAETTTTEPETTTTEPPTTTTTLPPTTTTAEAPTTTTEATTTTTEPDLPGIGEPVRDGKFEFVITGIEEPGKVYDPDNFLEDEANGVWFIVLMTVENIGDQQQSFFAGEQKLDWDGREFTAADFTWNGTSFEELNPGVTVEATVMFDVPENFPDAGAETVLELHDSFLSFGVNVFL